ncbi:MAG: class I SAM-dependent methyltransferase [Patescibacteria group bacterium]
MNHNQFALPHQMTAIARLGSHSERVRAIFENIEWERTFIPSPYGEAERLSLASYGVGYNPDSRLRMRYYERRTRAAADAANGARVLDVGCAFGTQCLLLATAGAAHVDGVDICAPYIAIAKKRLALWGADNVSCSARSVFDCDASEPYDLIFVMETLHHIVPFEDFFARVRVLLKPGGKLIISEPNGGNPFIHGRATRKGWNSGRKITTGGYVQTDEMYMPDAVVVRGLKDSGFEVNRVERYRVFPGGGTGMMDKLLAYAEPIVERLLPLKLLGVGYTVIAQRD